MSEPAKTFECYTCGPNQRSTTGDLSGKCVTCGEFFDPEAHRLSQQQVPVPTEQVTRRKSSVFRGVYRVSGFWRSALDIKRKTHLLGNYASETEAARAWDNAQFYLREALYLSGSPNLNFPGDYLDASRRPGIFPRTRRLLDALAVQKLVTR